MPRAAESMIRNVLFLIVSSLSMTRCLGVLRNTKFSMAMNASMLKGDCDPLSELSDQAPDVPYTCCGGLSCPHDGATCCKSSLTCCPPGWRCGKSGKSCVRLRPYQCCGDELDRLEAQLLIQNRKSILAANLEQDKKGMPDEERRDQEKSSPSSQNPSPSRQNAAAAAAAASQPIEFEATPMKPLPLSPNGTIVAPTEEKGGTTERPRGGAVERGQGDHLVAGRANTAGALDKTSLVNNGNNNLEAVKREVQKAVSAINDGKEAQTREMLDLMKAQLKHVNAELEDRRLMSQEKERLEEAIRQVQVEEEMAQAARNKDYAKALLLQSQLLKNLTINATATATAISNTFITTSPNGTVTTAVTTGGSISQQQQQLQQFPSSPVNLNDTNTAATRNGSSEAALNNTNMAAAIPSSLYPPTNTSNSSSSIIPTASTPSNTSSLLFNTGDTSSPTSLPTPGGPQMKKTLAPFRIFPFTTAHPSASSPFLKSDTNPTPKEPSLSGATQSPSSVESSNSSPLKETPSTSKSLPNNNTASPSDTTVGNHDNSTNNGSSAPLLSPKKQKSNNGSDGSFLSADERRRHPGCAAVPERPETLEREIKAIEASLKSLADDPPKDDDEKQEKKQHARALRKRLKRLQEILPLSRACLALAELRTKDFVAAERNLNLQYNALKATLRELRARTDRMEAAASVKSKFRRATKDLVRRLEEELKARRQLRTLNKNLHMLTNRIELLRSQRALAHKTSLELRILGTLNDTSKKNEAPVSEVSALLSPLSSPLKISFGLSKEERESRKSLGQQLERLTIEAGKLRGKISKAHQQQQQQQQAGASSSEASTKCCERRQQHSKAFTRAGNLGSSERPPLIINANEAARSAKKNGKRQRVSEKEMMTMMMETSASPRFRSALHKKEAESAATASFSSSSSKTTSTLAMDTFSSSSSSSSSSFVSLSSSSLSSHLLALEQQRAYESQSFLDDRIDLLRERQEGIHDALVAIMNKYGLSRPSQQQVETLDEEEDELERRMTEALVSKKRAEVDLEEAEEELNSLLLSFKRRKNKGWDSRELDEEPSSSSVIAGHNIKQLEQELRQLTESVERKRMALKNMEAKHNDLARKSNRLSAKITDVMRREIPAAKRKAKVYEADLRVEQHKLKHHLDRDRSKRVEYFLVKQRQLRVSIAREQALVEADVARFKASTENATIAAGLASEQVNHLRALRPTKTADLKHKWMSLNEALQRQSDSKKEAEESNSLLRKATEELIAVKERRIDVERIIKEIEKDQHKTEVRKQRVRSRTDEAKKAEKEVSALEALLRDNEKEKTIAQGQIEAMIQPLSELREQLKRTEAKVTNLSSRLDEERREAIVRLELKIKGAKDGQHDRQKALRNVQVHIGTLQSMMGNLAAKHHALMTSVAAQLRAKGRRGAADEVEALQQKMNAVTELQRDCASEKARIAGEVDSLERRRRKENFNAATGFLNGSLASTPQLGGGGALFDGDASNGTDNSSRPRRGASSQKYFSLAAGDNETSLLTALQLEDLNARIDRVELQMKSLDSKKCLRRQLKRAVEEAVGTDVIQQGDDEGDNATRSCTEEEPRKKSKTRTTPTGDRVIVIDETALLPLKKREGKLQEEINVLEKRVIPLQRTRNATEKNAAEAARRTANSRQIVQESAAKGKLVSALEEKANAIRDKLRSVQEKIKAIRKRKIDVEERVRKGEAEDAEQQKKDEKMLRDELSGSVDDAPPDLIISTESDIRNRDKGNQSSSSSPPPCAPNCGDGKLVDGDHLAGDVEVLEDDLRQQSGARRSRRNCRELGWTVSAFDRTICGHSEIKTGGVCSGKVTFVKAKGACEALGARLCTVTELERDATRGTGCGYDEEPTWSASSCNSGKGHWTRKGATDFEDVGLRTCSHDNQALMVARCCADVHGTSTSVIPERSTLRDSLDDKGTVVVRSDTASDQYKEEIRKLTEEELKKMFIPQPPCQKGRNEGEGANEGEPCESLTIE
eukprot:jgi/Bigna1/70270/fgenesh1_pg.11_\